MPPKTVLSELDKLRNQSNISHEEQHHETHIFPSKTDLDCILTCGAIADTWSAWAELQDNEATTFSSKIKGAGIDISAIIVEEASNTDKVYMLEIAYGSPKVTATRVRFIAGAQQKLPAIQSARIRTAKIRGNPTLYYRAMGETGGATFNIHIRYFYHS